MGSDELVINSFRSLWRSKPESRKEIEKTVAMIKDGRITEDTAQMVASIMIIMDATLDSIRVKKRDGDKKSC